MNPNPKAFLGKGWPFPIKPDQQGNGIKLMEYEKCVEQSIRLILGTHPGERVMNPEYGCILWNMVFEPIGSGTEQEVSRIVRESLIKWEPRIRVDDVVTTINSDHYGRIDVSVTYTITRTNTTFNLVYPFFLERQ